MFAALLNSVRLLARPEWTRGGLDTAAVRHGKQVGDNSEPIVVFLVGVRINTWWKMRYWVPLLLSLPSMVRELMAEPDGGLLGYRLMIGPGPRQAMLVQYWRGSAELRAFAHASEGSHQSAQRRFWRHYAASGGVVGVWHEVLPAAAGEHHSLYGNMPPTGIGGLRGVRPASWAYAGSAGGGAQVDAAAVGVGGHDLGRQPR